MTSLLKISFNKKSKEDVTKIFLHKENTYVALSYIKSFISIVKKKYDCNSPTSLDIFYANNRPNELSRCTFVDFFGNIFRYKPETFFNLFPNENF